MSKAAELAALIANVNNGSSLAAKNFIINGNQMVDQRNSGSALTASASHQYATDRFICRLGTSSSSTIQQVSDAPDGFEKSMKLTIGTGASPSSSTGTGYFAHRIEGNNIAHLGWGSSGANTVTLSFWVKSSVTGSFGVTLSNFDVSRSYPSSYTISSANTWEYKTVTVSGDTSGTWKTDTNSGIEIWFDWGNGSNFKGTANTWAGADYRGGASGTVNICATSSATWFITGVQLEVGEKATEFEHEPYCTTLTKCQRYYQYQDIYFDKGGSYNSGGDALAYYYNTPFTEFMRQAPTLTASAIGSNTGNATSRHGTTIVNGWLLSTAYNNSATIRGNHSYIWNYIYGRAKWDAEL